MRLPLARTVALLAGWALLSAACAPAAAPPAAPASAPKPAVTTAPATAPPPAAAASPAAKPAAPTTVQMATLRAASDAGLFIALERGYFTEQGID
jgi:hypothetical protein